MKFPPSPASCCKFAGLELEDTPHEPRTQIFVPGFDPVSRRVVDLGTDRRFLSEEAPELGRK
jgi:hypothetical protein